MGAPPIPSLHLLPGCGHLFLPSDIGPNNFASLSLNDLNPMGRIGPLGTNSVSQLGQFTQLGPLGHLAALQINACRPVITSIPFNQTECSSGSTGSFRPIISPDSELGTPLPNHFRTSINQTLVKRPRSEKKPIPEEHKDDKYYERRKRNNQAAKKSRDARKIREDQVALRAAILEHENNVLRAQLMTLREEARALRRLLLVRSNSHSPLISSQCANN